MLDMHVSNIKGVLFDYSRLECLAATLFDVIFLVRPYVFMISADADSPSGKVVLEAAWARTEYDTDEDPATEDPDVPLLYTGIMGPARRYHWGREAVYASAATVAGNARSPDCWVLSDLNFPTNDRWESVSSLIWQVASD